METTVSSSAEALDRAFSALRPFSEIDRWETSSHLWHLKAIERILKNLGPGAEVIDVGCYIGILPLALRMLGVNASGNDKYVFYPRETAHAYGFSVGELKQLQSVWAEHGLVVHAWDVLSEVAPRHYDVVVSIATIEHQAYPKQFLDNVASFAKPGGIIYLSTPNASKLANRVRFLLGRPPMHNIDEFYMNGHDFNGHWREYTLRELIRMAELSGLDVLEAKTTQMEPVGFRITSPGKWLRSIARLLSHIVPGSGDINVLVLKK